MFQRTVKDKIELEGVGVHTGRHSRIIIEPAGVDTGIIFKRREFSFPADINHVIETGYNIALGEGKIVIKSCEHLLAAIYGLGLTNLIITVEGDEIPHLDGSSKVFVDEILKTGVTEQDREVEELKLTLPVKEGNNEAFIIGLPCGEKSGDRLFISYFIDYGRKDFKPQLIRIELNEENFINDIAPARTYVFEDWLGKLFMNRLAMGGNFESAIIWTKDGPRTELRFCDECVRHKVLDLMGALALLGARFIGEIIAVRSGHELDVEFIKRLKISRLED